MVVGLASSCTSWFCLLWYGEKENKNKLSIRPYAEEKQYIQGSISLAAFWVHLIKRPNPFIHWNYCRVYLAWGVVGSAFVRLTTPHETPHQLAGHNLLLQDTVGKTECRFREVVKSRFGCSGLSLRRLSRREITSRLRFQLIIRS
jgi:hypothetical protein